MSDDWDESEIVRLRREWDEGASTAEIGRRHGRSKNAIVGKCHRLAFPVRPSPIRRDGPPRQPRLTRGHSLPALAPLISLARLMTPPAPPPKPPISKLTCQWLNGNDRKTWKFCDAPVKPKEPDRPQSAYCAEHHRRCNVKLRDLRDDAA